jgi:hypothetical protein
MLLVTAGLSEEGVVSQQDAAADLRGSADLPEPRLDTMWVIPAGPLAGSFSSDSRLQVLDTVAGWAKISVEGWVPVGCVLDRMNGVNFYNTANSVVAEPVVERARCSATTQKGTRCKRLAQPGKTTCWQHSAE